ncbi:hypothetical protein [uncultured Pseudacidovorax sp.]|uniref:hypothetical protein n=1 Tax=uncultured Pseudacidovorax sp. TaxID=679313 RepID=UPI0025D1B7A0|nr:hypothetical protein [uncultured Pseudacidovorax sp.]
MSNAPHIDQLRTHLLDTLAALKDRDNPMDPNRARAVAEVASVLVDSAKVEVDYLKVTGQDKSGFLEGPASAPALPPASGYTQGHVERGDGVTRHTLKG